MLIKIGKSVQFRTWKRFRFFMSAARDLFVIVTTLLLRPVVDFEWLLWNHGRVCFFCRSRQLFLMHFRFVLLIFIFLLFDRARLCPTVRSFFWSLLTRDRNRASYGSFSGALRMTFRIKTGDFGWDLEKFEHAGCFWPETLRSKISCNSESVRRRSEKSRFRPLACRSAYTHKSVHWICRLHRLNIQMFHIRRMHTSSLIIIISIKCNQSYGPSNHLNVVKWNADRVFIEAFRGFNCKLSFKIIDRRWKLSIRSNKANTHPINA